MQLADAARNGAWVRAVHKRRSPRRERRRDRRLIIGLFGLGWGMATYLVVPVLVMEEAGVMDSIRRSASLLRQTWGEQIISGLAFGWLGLLFAVPGIVLGVLGANGYPIFIVLAILWFATMIAAFTAAGEIFTVALYRYATTGQSPSGYDAPPWARPWARPYDAGEPPQRANTWREIDGR